MKKLFWLMTALLIFGMVLSACQPAPTEAPTEEAQEPVAEE